MNDAVRVARINARAHQNALLLEGLRDAAKNPIVQLLAGFAAVEFLARARLTIGGDRDTHPNSPLLSSEAAKALYVGVVGTVTFQQLAPSLPYLAQGGATMLTSLATALPAVLP